MANSPQPNEEQLDALDSFAENKGAQWKSKLRDAWMDGTDSSFKDGHLLRQVRNQFGPKWLETYQPETDSPTPPAKTMKP